MSASTALGWLAAAAVQGGPAGAAPRQVLPPRGWWEYAVVALAAAVALLAVVWLVVGFFRPGEDDPNHIKYRILVEPEKERSEDDACPDEA